MALGTIAGVELSVPFLDISNNFFGQKITVTGVGKTSNAVVLNGTLPDFERAGTQIVKEGRFFSQFENDGNAECVRDGFKSVGEDFFPLWIADRSDPSVSAACSFVSWACWKSGNSFCLAAATTIRTTSFTCPSMSRAN